jgi:AcrR family transcriptional regulator
MSQRKKDGVREAILQAAFRLFSEQGYSETSLPMIAREAGMSTANVYVYFASKIDILFTLYEPWLTQRLDRLERPLARVAAPRRRLERLLLALWRDLPRESNGFANNVMQAVSTSARNGEYSPRLRELFQARVARWLRGCLPLEPGEDVRLAGIVLMAFDGFAMNAHLSNGIVCDAATARVAAGLLAGPAPPADAAAPAPVSPSGRAAAKHPPARRRAPRPAP